MNLKKQTFLLPFLPLLLCVLLPFVAAADEKDKEDVAGKLRDLNLKLMTQLAPSVADAEYFFSVDETGSRKEFSVSYICPHCREPHYQPADSLIREQRPFQVPAYAVAADEFVSSDIGVIGEWLASVDLVFQGKRYPAKIVACYPDRGSVLLKTAGPVPGVVPLKFNPKAEGKRFGFFRNEEDGVIRASVMPWSPPAVYRDFGTGKDYVPALGNTIVVNGDGEVIGLSMRKEIEVGDEPAETPADWKKIPFEVYEKQLADFKTMLEKNIYPAIVQLQPVKALTGFAAHYRRTDGETRNEAGGVAVKMKDGRVLVAALLTPVETARLSRIVIMADGKEIPAKFVGSLRFFGGIIVKPEQPLPGEGIPFYSGDLRKLNRSPIYAATVKPLGKQLSLQVVPGFLDSFSVGFRNMVVPDRRGLIFTRTGELLAMPLMERGDRGRYDDSVEPVSAAMILTLAGNFDPLNVPKAGAAEQIAWLGVEFQQLDAELARANKVAEFTEDGRRGLLVTYVYQNSPAAEMGIKPGDVLLGLRAEENPVPAFLEGEEFGNPMEQFPWNEYDRIPQQYFDRIPPPWGTTRDNRLNIMLGNIGIGGKARLMAVTDGKAREIPFTVSASPANFDTTEKFNDTNLGMTVCDLTYEVRNYFQLKPEDGGVIVSAVKMGSRAAVAGIRPYEIIVSVDGEPVKDLKSFRKLTEGKSELRIGVRRFAVTRIVTIGANTAPARPAAE